MFHLKTNLLRQNRLYCFCPKQKNGCAKESRTFDYGWHKKFTLIVHSTRQKLCEWF
ncbi:hypothetical protein PAHAL_9G354700 [Panicum hallii]|uniref:Uncharacterized protein n=1 Tax=Panicum hallii TaxID=206008 RepID=A0A2T8I3K0_9POAL|nr:hypothetical protein PAHAL_9G354700 [Panicum hallii]